MSYQVPNKPSPKKNKIRCHTGVATGGPTRVKATDMERVITQLGQIAVYIERLQDMLSPHMQEDSLLIEQVEALQLKK